METSLKNIFRVTCICILLLPLGSFAQNKEPASQSIIGLIKDKQSGEGIEKVSVKIDGKHTLSESGGKFILDSIPLGRYSITFSKTGYTTYIIKEVLVGSGKPILLELGLSPLHVALDEVHIKPQINKSTPLNDNALIGAQMFSVDEASRFAGGMDDPARLMSAYAGVSTPSISNNGISVRGNNPAHLQWRLEGVEIPNPNHFANLEVLGGGFLSTLSSNVLGNSDFLLGAFPAEYNNALSGVFDMRLRNGDRYQHKHTVEIGMLGIDLATEGPFNHQHQSSYLINYRHATTKLLESLAGRDEMGGTLGYQDLNFKLNFPGKRGNSLSVWGTGLIDEVDPILENEKDWDYAEEGLLSAAKQKSGAMGITHKHYFGQQQSNLTTSLAFSYSGSDAQEHVHNPNGDRFLKTKFKNHTSNLILTSALRHQFGPKHSNQTGFTWTNLGYNMQLDQAETSDQQLSTYIHNNGHTQRLSAYTHSKFDLNNDFTLSVGINAQYLNLSQAFSVEPRLSMKWMIAPRSSVALGYGLHGKTENLEVYFVQDSLGNLPNKSLGFTKAHHLLLAWNFTISPDMHLKVEPYYQLLFNVPVSPEGTYSLLNRQEYYMRKTLIAEGKGQNYGIDITLEKYLSKNLYYLLSASVYNSQYKGAQTDWLNSRYNRNFIVNALIGKEWFFNSNILSINLKTTFMGGNRYTPVDIDATLSDPEKVVHYQDQKAFAQQFSPMLIGDISISYKINKPRLAHEFSLKSVNASKQREYQEHRYNIRTHNIDAYRPVNSLFNASYRIEF